MQIVARELEIGFVTQSTFARRDGVGITAELVVSGADVIPSFGVIWLEFQCRFTRVDCFRVTTSLVMFKAGGEIRFRSRRLRAKRVGMGEEITRRHIAGAQIERVSVK